MKNAGILLFVLLLAITGFSQRPIAEIQGEADASPLMGESVTIEGIVTASGTGRGYFLQDTAALWSGVFIYDLDRDPIPAIGDLVRLTGIVDEYYELTEIKDVSGYEVLSSGNPLPEPIVVESGSIGEAHEGVLVTINSAECTARSIGFGEWQVDDGSGPLAVDDLFFEFTPVEGIAYDITGPCHYTYEAYKLEPRSGDDVKINAALYFTSDPVQTVLSKSAITLNWTTNVEASTEVSYGKTKALEMGKMDVQGEDTNHEISLTGLDAGELYYVKAYSVAGTDTTPTGISSYTTISNSSGKMKVAFVQAQFMGSAETALHTFSIADSIVSYIEKAQETLDIAIYDVLNHAEQSTNVRDKIFDAIKAKANAGVNVRIITDDGSNDEFFTDMMEPGNVMWGNTDGIMHHKFIIVDAESASNSWVMTGSTNWTYNNLVMDANNLIGIQDQSLAKAYREEFNEMWGGAQEEPDYTKSKFASDKSDNTPHLFEIGGVKTELYFSPSDGTESKIVAAIESADHEIAFNIMAFTADNIRIALLDAHSRGVLIRGVIDYIEYTGSEFEPLEEAGVDVVDYQNANGESWPDNPTVHHKFITIDYDHPDSDPVLVTGTHNWSASAESRNDENTLFIYDAELAKIYADEALLVYSKSDPGTVVEEELSSQISLYPIPAKEMLYLESEAKISSVKIYDVQGRRRMNIITRGETRLQISLDKLEKGIYVLKAINDKGEAFQKRFAKY